MSDNNKTTVGNILRGANKASGDLVDAAQNISALLAGGSKIPGSDLTGKAVDGAISGVEGVLAKAKQVGNGAKESGMEGGQSVDPNTQHSPSQGGGQGQSQGSSHTK